MASISAPGTSVLSYSLISTIFDLCLVYIGMRVMFLSLKKTTHNMTTTSTTIIESTSHKHLRDSGPWEYLTSLVFPRRPWFKEERDVCRALGFVAEEAAQGLREPWEGLEFCTFVRVWGCVSGERVVGCWAPRRGLSDSLFPAAWNGLHPFSWDFPLLCKLHGQCPCGSSLTDAHGHGLLW